MRSSHLGGLPELAISTEAASRDSALLRGSDGRQQVRQEEVKLRVKTFFSSRDTCKTQGPERIFWRQIQSGDGGFSSTLTWLSKSKGEKTACVNEL